MQNILKVFLKFHLDFFCLKDPPAAFRGFANLSFKFSKIFLPIYISHLISNNLGTCVVLIVLGIESIVFKFSKISSPIIPSPLDNPLIRIPFS